MRCKNGNAGFHTDDDRLDIQSICITEANPYMYITSKCLLLSINRFTCLLSLIFRKKKKGAKDVSSDDSNM